MRLPLVLSLAILAICITEISSHNLGKKLCSCGLKSGGTDVCGGCDSTVVRPPPPQKFGLPTKEELLEKLVDLLPGNKIVKPPPIPEKIVFDKPSHYVEKVEVPYVYRVYPHKYVDVFDKYEPNEEDDEFIKIPIDAVSLTLAYELSKQKGINVKEDSLNFGPRILPREDGVVKYYKDVPEHGLVNFDKKIIELKYPGEKKKLIPYEDDEEEYDIFHKGLTYEDIGYFPEGSLKDHKCIFKPSVSVEEFVPYKVKPYILPKPKKGIKEWGLYLGSKEYEEEYVGEDSSEEWLEWKVVAPKIGSGKGILQCDEFLDKYYKGKY